MRKKQSGFGDPKTFIRYTFVGKTDRACNRKTPNGFVNISGVFSMHVSTAFLTGKAVFFHFKSVVKTVSTKACKNPGICA